MFPHQQHFNHFCKFCCSNSDHFAKDCPKTVELFHATALEHLKIEQGISEIGLVPSKSGRLGPGIYFAKQEVVEKIKVLIETGHNKPAVVLRCKVKLGECFEYANKSDTKGEWAKTHDSCTGIHPPWKGATTDPFQEWVLKDPKMCRVYDILVGNVFVRMDEYRKIMQFRKTLLELFRTNNNSEEIAQQMMISFIG